MPACVPSPQAPTASNQATRESVQHGRTAQVQPKRSHLKRGVSGRPRLEQVQRELRWEAGHQELDAEGDTDEAARSGAWRRSLARKLLIHEKRIAEAEAAKIELRLRLLDV